EMLPAVAQGAIGVETRSDDKKIHALIDVLNHEDDATCVLTERSFLARLEGGCQVPIAGHATLIAGTLYLEGLVGEVDGSRIFREHISGPRDEAVDLGTRLADALLEAGGKSILDKLYSQ
ncbi:MAG: hydroxymethylbilane synthase, partial [Mariprofundaceae bacterium]